MKDERDYVLGTGDAEIERLGLQHRVWRPHMLDAFARAGIRPGLTMLDVGAGPALRRSTLPRSSDPVGR